ncbi:MAG TPA: hypothetical protein VN901_30000 [Candidatus Acidoferrales bacterium]|jgi:hypothetical protein|nr:hypothetical protein [Candidatus Acidoferrales bacterium]
MAKKKITSGMWRIDPQKQSRIMDRFGRTVASMEPEVDPSLMASAPDMFELLERLEEEGSIPQELCEEIQMVLSRARGDFGLAVFSRNSFKRRTVNKEWLEFMDGLLKPPLGTE